MKTSIILLTVALAAIVLEASGDQSGGVSQEVDDLRDPLQSLTQQVNDKLRRTRSSTKREVLGRIGQQLQEFNDSFDNLLNRVEAYRNHQQAQIDQQNQLAYSNWKKWADAEKAKAAERSLYDPEIISKVNNVIDDFVNRFRNDLSQCPVDHDYEEQIRDAIEKYPDDVKNLESPLQECLRLSDSNLVGRLCDSHTSAALSQLRQAQNEVANFIRQGDQLIQERYEGNFCVIVNVVQFYLERNTIETKIDQIIKDAIEGTTTESNTSEVTTPEGCTTDGNSD